MFLFGCFGPLLFFLPNILYVTSLDRAAVDGLNDRIYVLSYKVYELSRFGDVFISF